MGRRVAQGISAKLVLKGLFDDRSIVLNNFHEIPP
jgi:hypothetical protein